jgi:hypothetical protein
VLENRVPREDIWASKGRDKRGMDDTR